MTRRNLKQSAVVLMVFLGMLAIVLFLRIGASVGLYEARMYTANHKLYPIIQELRRGNVPDTKHTVLQSETLIVVVSSESIEGRGRVILAFDRIEGTYSQYVLQGL